MLEIKVDARELYDEEHNLFIEIKPITLRLEHSLLSVSRWEAKWKKPFLVTSPAKTYEESLDYVRCMTVNKNVDPNVYLCLTREDMVKINDYCWDQKTATAFTQTKANKKTGQYMTSEIIYYSMFANNVPIECEKWHLSRLLTLLTVFDKKAKPGKKMSKRDILLRNQELNEARKAKLHSRG